MRSWQWLPPMDRLHAERQAALEEVSAVLAVKTAEAEAAKTQAAEQLAAVEKAEAALEEAGAALPPLGGFFAYQRKGKAFGA